jgi:YhcH/YjgK/YiaL family protein
MILDVLENAHRYLALNKGFVKAIEFLLCPDLKELPVGKYEIDGDRVYATVSKDPGRKKEDALLETHEKYIDIQLVVAGTDDMGWKPKLSCKQPSGEYDQKRDVQFFADDPEVWLATKSGSFAIFFPEDAHMPLISSGQLHKVVVKVVVGATPCGCPS